CSACVFAFFFPAEDGIRDRNVTGVQTCALPICTNIGKRLAIKVPLDKGVAKVCGEYVMAGVKDPGAKYLVDIQRPGGGKTGSTLPLSAKAVMETDEGEISYSFTDLVNPFVYVKGKELSLTGSESYEELANDLKLLDKIEQIRVYAAIRSGLSPGIEDATNKYIALPKVSFVSGPIDY